MRYNFTRIKGKAFARFPNETICSKLSPSGRTRSISESFDFDSAFDVNKPSRFSRNVTQDPAISSSLNTEKCNKCDRKFTFSFLVKKDNCIAKNLTIRRIFAIYTPETITDRPKFAIRDFRPRPRRTRTSPAAEGGREGETGGGGERGE